MTSRAHLRTVAALGFGALLVLLLWSRALSPWPVAAALVLLLPAAGLELRRVRRRGRLDLLTLALTALLLAVLAASATTLRLERGADAWETVTAERDLRLSARLEDRMRGVLRRTTAAAYLAADPGSESSFETLLRIRERTAVDAVMLVDPWGRPVVWSGEHRGRIPAAVAERGSGIVYGGGALFNYLYAVAPAGGGMRAVSAVLMQAGPPLRGSVETVAQRFEAVTGERPRFLAGESQPDDWTLDVQGEPVISAQFPALTQSDWRSRVARTGRQVVFVLALLALVALSGAWLRRPDHRSGIAVLAPTAAASAALMAAPLRQTLGLERLFSPGYFVLPIPGDFVIEGVIVLLVPLAALVSTFRPPPVRRRELWLRLLIAGALAGAGFAIAAGLMTGSAGAPMLTSGGPLWYVLHPTTVLLLALLGVLLMPRSRDPDPRGRILAWGATGGALSLFLGLALAGSWGPEAGGGALVLMVWSVPFVLIARAVAGYSGRGDRLLRWLMAGWLAATAVIPFQWNASQEARLRTAEREVVGFGAAADPYLSYLLRQFARELTAPPGQVERDVEHLYETWVASGLAGEPYPLEITAWAPDLRPRATLSLGLDLDGSSPAQADVRALVQRVMGEDSVLSAAGSGESTWILAVPDGEGGAVSVTVGPRTGLSPGSALAAFMESERPPGAELELLPVGQPAPASEATVRWERMEDGWRSETIVREGGEAYHAHLFVRVPPPGVRLARALLLLSLDFLLLSLIWGLGRLARGDPPRPAGGWGAWLGGFRARLILALFAFFLLPTAIFGWAAYGALAGEVTRAARQVAERAVVHAASIVSQESLPEIARRTGEDVLYYQDGVLSAASEPEAAELGLYGAWMPPALYQLVRGGEALGGVETGELAGRSYLVAYRRLPRTGSAVAVPVWLAARDVAVRQQEFAHLVLFGILVGGVLSLALSVRVGRALAQPISELRRAAAAVGRGRLGVRLPERRRDEFGELFSSFNRMTRRLRRARAREVRSARILAWGEMARQVAHEIKNPLTPIKLSVQHIRRAYKDDRADYGTILDSNVHQILQEIDRLTEIARAFSRYGAPEDSAGALEPVDVGAIAQDVLTLYRAPDRLVTYRLALDCDDCLAGARAAELREVIINLLENARAAVGDEGLVELVVERQERALRLSVRDDGEGIPGEQLSRIFEPHFSTRSSGTGLGLAIVRRLVESWGGEVGASSEPGAGTVVWLTVPVLPVSGSKDE